MVGLMWRTVTSALVVVCALLLAAVLGVLRVLARRRVWRAAEVLAVARGESFARTIPARVEVVRVAPVNRRRERPPLLLDAPRAALEFVAGGAR